MRESVGGVEKKMKKQKLTPLLSTFSNPLLPFLQPPTTNNQVYDTYVLSDPVGWVKGWGALAADVAADPVMKNRVMFDLMNEPDGRGIGWTTVSDCFCLSLFSFFLRNAATLCDVFVIVFALWGTRRREIPSQQRQRQLSDKEAKQKTHFLSFLSLHLSYSPPPFSH